MFHFQEGASGVIHERARGDLLSQRLWSSYDTSRHQPSPVPHCVAVTNSVITPTPTLPRGVELPSKGSNWLLGEGGAKKSHSCYKAHVGVTDRYTDIQYNREMNISGRGTLSKKGYKVSLGEVQVKHMLRNPASTGKRG